MNCFKTSFVGWTGLVYPLDRIFGNIQTQRWYWLWSYMLPGWSKQTGVWQREAERINELQHEIRCDSFQIKTLQLIGSRSLITLRSRNKDSKSVSHHVMLVSVTFLATVFVREGSTCVKTVTQIEILSLWATVLLCWCLMTNEFSHKISGTMIMSEQGRGKCQNCSVDDLLWTKSTEKIILTSEIFHPTSIPFTI